MKILVVDDYMTMRKIMRKLLAQIGLTDVEEAENGTAALARLHAGSFDLVISDWNMEPMSGMELLKAIRAAPAWRALPFIMVTAESKTDNVLEAKRAGVSNYIVKPFNAETLKAKIQQVTILPTAA